jgi:uncharacterized protein YdcH (DUF465 family)
MEGVNKPALFQGFNGRSLRCQKLQQLPVEDVGHLEKRNVPDVRNQDQLSVWDGLGQMFDLLRIIGAIQIPAYHQCLGFDVRPIVNHRILVGHLAEQHAQYHKQLEALEAKPRLTPEEEMEEHRLKKLKLRLKDQMNAIISRYRAQNVA